MICNPSRVSVVVALWLVSWAASSDARAQVDSPFRELASAPPPIKAALIAGDWSEAVSRIQASEEIDDYLTFLLGLAKLRVGEPGPALATWEALERRFPDSAWLPKARFYRAETLRQIGRAAEAEELFEREARRLMSADRKTALADIFFTHADAASREPDPSRPGDPPSNLSRALELYRKILELGAPRPVDDRALYRVAWCLEQQEQWGEASAAWTRYLNEFDPTKGDPNRSAGQWVFEARRSLGLALWRQGQLLPARQAWEDLAGEIASALRGEEPWGALQADADRRQAWDAIRAEALFRIGEAFQPNEALAAIGSRRRFLESYPANDRSAEAAFSIASLYAAIGRQEDALEAYDAYLAGSGYRATTDTAREKAAELERQAVFERGQVLLAQQRFDDAIRAFSDYVNRFPNGSAWSDSQRGIIAAEFAAGGAAFAAKDWSGARAAWNRFLERHPLDERVPEIYFALGETWVAEARGLEVDDADRVERQQGLYRRAIEQWRRLASKFPGSNIASRGLYESGLLLELDLGELTAAIVAYRSCNFGSWHGPSSQRLLQMTRKSLAVSTERVFRSGQKAEIAVQARNLERVEVSIYELDLDGYFRKQRTIGGVEDLDLDLIQPGQTFEIALDDYSPYRALEQRIAIPMSDGPGVVAVAVTSDQFRATTLVVRSDLDLIIKSSRHELFVFAEHMRQIAPASGVRVLVSLPEGALEEGEGGMFEGTTDAEGIFRFRHPGLERADEVRVFAVSDLGIASNALSLGGLNLAKSLEPRGYLTTDRPVYRPGQIVGIRGVLREVVQGSYDFKAGRAYWLEVLDSAGRPLAKRSLPLSEYGTLATELALDRYAPVGRYIIRCQAATGPVFAGSFEVREYQLQKIELSLDLERVVYYRGETVTGTVTARTYYGEPIRGGSVKVRWPDGREESFRTDDSGRARLEFDTTARPSSGSLTFVAELLGEGVSTQESVFLSTTGFGATVATSRDVYLEGESFDVAVETRAPDGSPVAQNLRLRVLRRESRGDTWAEVEVGSHAVSTDDTGHARRNIQVEKGGSYTLRVEGQDRFRQPISAERLVTISGAEDEIKLRWLSETQQLRVGERHRLVLHNRAGPGLALVTFEGDRIFEHRLVRLEVGSNELSFDIDHQHFPNFVLAAALMGDDAFFETSADFHVARKLDVTISPRKSVLAPGEELEVDLIARDQLGRPVRAELAIGVIDAAVLAVHPDRTPDILTFFQSGAQRAASFRTIATCTFAYQGVTRTISEEVLAEERRVEAESKALKKLEAIQDKARDLGGLAARKNAQSVAGRAFAFDRLSADDERFEAEDFNDMIGLGGGAGGKFGGRAGGRRVRRDQQPRADLRETAFWSPAVATDDRGRATVRFTMPDQATRWRLQCRGVTTESLVGQTQAEVITRQDFFLEVQRPARLIEGDRPELLVRVHSAIEASGDIELKLRLGHAEGGSVQSRTVRLEGAGIHEFLLASTDPIPLTDAVKIDVEAQGELAGAERGDRLLLTVPVQAYGLPVADSRSGRLTGGEARVELDLGSPRVRGRRLELELGIGTEELLITEALGSWGMRLGRSILGTQADVSGELIGLCSVITYLERIDQASIAVRRDLRERAEALVARLVASQTSAGGWAWHGTSVTPDPATSALALWALGEAQRAAFEIPPDSVARALAYVTEQFSQVASGDPDRKALLLAALTRHGRGDFSAANRLHRQRMDLSPAALAYTMLALVDLERSSMARELASLLTARASEELSEDRRRCPWPLEQNDAWTRRPVEMTALALLALERAEAGGSAIPRAVESLHASRPWPSGKGKGLALAALSAHAAGQPLAVTEARVEILIGDQVVESVHLSRARARFQRAWEGDELGSGSVTLTLRSAGRGDLSFAAVLTGLSDDVVDVECEQFSIRSATLLAAAPRVGGRSVDTGFSILSEPGERWENEVTQLPTGETARCEIELVRRVDPREQVESGDYVVIDVPLPAGMTWLEGSVEEACDRAGVSWEPGLGALRFYVPPSRVATRLEFEVVGSVTGRYRSLPVVASSAYEPSRRAARVMKDRRVLARGATSADAYRATPDERFALGSAAFTQGDFDSAHDHLLPLLTVWRESLRADVLREVVRQMFFISVARRDAEQVVETFEVLKERYPELTIPFDQVLAVGDAYRQMEEFERASLVFRAAIVETFGRDLKVPGVLSEQGEFVASVEALRSLWLEFPDTPEVVQAYLTLSDQLSARVATASQDERLRSLGVDGPLLLLETVRVLSRFLALYSGDPLADEAGLSLVSTYLAMRDFETAAELAERLGQRVQQDRFQDHFLYAQAVAEWSAGHLDRAIQLAGRVAESTAMGDDGREQPSENRSLALYILGQIHHAQQKPTEAIRYYEQVKEEFSDAREAIAYFREQRLDLAEVTTAAPGDSLALELRHRNLKSVELLAYPVDLMTLTLREKSLRSVTSVNLAGIQPTFRREVTLGTGQDFVTQETRVPLELEEAGAYLVIARSGDRHTSGLVLVSPLKLEVDEDPVSGRVRVVVQDRASGRYQSGVEVKVIGSSNHTFEGGRTDLRGVFVADAIAGQATVIARAAENRYAFHRGAIALGAAVRNRRDSRDSPGQEVEGIPGYFRNIFRENDRRQEIRRQRLQQEMNKERAGIQVRQAK